MTDRCDKSYTEGYNDGIKDFKKRLTSKKVIDKLFKKYDVMRNYLAIPFIIDDAISEADGK